MDQSLSRRSITSCRWRLTPSCAKTRTATTSPSAGLRPFGDVANTDTKLLIYGLFQKGRVLAQDGVNQADLDEGRRQDGLTSEECAELRLRGKGPPLRAAPRTDPSERC